MKPTASLFTKILFWFFLNMVIVAAVLTAFFALQPRINLHAIFGQQGIDRLRAAAMLIAHDIRQAPQADWPDILDLQRLKICPDRLCTGSGTPCDTGLPNSLYIRRG